MLVLLVEVLDEVLDVEVLLVGVLGPEGLEVLVLPKDVLVLPVEVLDVEALEVLVPAVLVPDVEVLDVEVLEVLVFRCHGDANKRLAGSWLSRMPYQKRNL